MSPHRKGTLYVVIAALLWSSGGIGIKGVDEPALKVTFYRSLFAAIALMLFLPRTAWAKRSWSSNRAFAFAIISYAACLTSFVVATKWTTAANAIFLQYAGAVWVMLLSPLILHEPIRGRDVAAIVAALGGMALFFFGKFDTRGMNGNILALVSSVFFAFLIMSLRRDQEASRAAVTWGNVLCALAVLPFIATDMSLSMQSFVILLLMGILQIALAYWFFTRGLALITATQASLTGMIEPIANPMWVFLFLGERASPYAIAGAVVVLAAIGWHTLTGEPVADLPAVD
jgi:drug/metabolite transporter, DME family